MSTTIITTPNPDSHMSGDFAAARKAMIDSQLRTSGVNEPFVLTAMNRVPREDYVPAAMHGAAYIDRAIAVDGGGAIAAPLFYGRVLQEARPRSDDTVLIVDNGSRYLPALVAPMAGNVDVITPAEAAKTSRKKVRYSLLLIDGAVEDFPESLTKRLADDARIVTGLVQRGVTRLAAGKVVNGKASFMPLAEEGIPVLSAFNAKQEWSF